jgi:hypothetical protein
VTEARPTRSKHPCAQWHCASNACAWRGGCIFSTTSLHTRSHCPSASHSNVADKPTHAYYDAVRVFVFLTHPRLSVQAPCCVLLSLTHPMVSPWVWRSRNPWLIAVCKQSLCPELSTVVLSTTLTLLTKLGMGIRLYHQQVANKSSHSTLMTISKTHRLLANLTISKTHRLLANLETCFKLAATTRPTAASFDRS